MFIGLVLVALGIVFLLKNLGIITGSVWDYIWPILVIAVGLSLILGRGRWGMRWHTHGCCEPERKEKE